MAFLITLAVLALIVALLSFWTWGQKYLHMWRRFDVQIIYISLCHLLNYVIGVLWKFTWPGIIAFIVGLVPYILVGFVLESVIDLLKVEHPRWGSFLSSYRISSLLLLPTAVITWIVYVSAAQNGNLIVTIVLTLMNLAIVWSFSYWESELRRNKKWGG